MSAVPSESAPIVLADHIEAELDAVMVPETHEENNADVDLLADQQPDDAEQETRQTGDPILREMVKTYREDIYVQRKLRESQKPSASETLPVELARQPLGSYFHEANKYSILTKEQEVDLWWAMQRGKVAFASLQNTDKTLEAESAENTAQLELLAKEGTFAFELFYRSNLRLVASLAHRADSSHTEVEDLVHYGLTGLQHALEMFDATKGFKFSTYATWWIKQRMINAVSDEILPVRLPRHAYTKFKKIKKLSREYYAEYEREIPIDELVAQTGFAKKMVVSLLQYGSKLDSPASLNKLTGDTDTELGDFVGVSTMDEDIEDISRRQQVAKLFTDARLTQRDAVILSLHFGVKVPKLEGAYIEEIGSTYDAIFENDKEYTSTEIAALFGLPAWSIRTAKDRALKDLRIAAARARHQAGTVPTQEVGLLPRQQETDNQNAEQLTSETPVNRPRKVQIGQKGAELLLKEGSLYARARANRKLLRSLARLSKVYDNVDENQVIELKEANRHLDRAAARIRSDRHYPSEIIELE